MTPARIALLLLLVSLIAASAVACPTCSETLTDGQNPGGLARGFFWSIIAMLAVPLALVAGGVSFVWRRLRANDRARLADALAHDAARPHAARDVTT